MPIINNNDTGISIRNKFNDNGTVKNNFGASTDPTVGDDSADGYEIGSKWINTSSDEEFVCLDAGVGAAVWSSTTAQGAGGAGLDSAAVIALLQPNIDSNATDISALSSRIDSDRTSSLNADSNLQAQIDSNATDINTINGLIPLNNWVATSNPDTSNDNTEGYQVGSSWINVTADEEYICVDASTGAAVWLSTTDQAAGGSGLDSSAALALIQPRIDSNASDISILSARIDSDRTSSLNADSNLQAQIDSNATYMKSIVGGGLDSAAAIALLQPNIDSNATDISAEITARINADSNLQAGIDSNATDIAALRTADTTLQTNIDSNAIDISAEITARINADSNLQAQIDSNETYMKGISAAGGDAWGDAVDANIIPDASGTRNLGSDSFSFGAAYLDSLYVGSIGIGGSGVADPNADAFFMWNDSDSNMEFNTLGSGLSRVGSTIVTDVNLTDSATLTNKTLTQPILDSATLNNPIIVGLVLDSAVINTPDINLGTIDSSTISNSIVNSPDINLGTIDSAAITNPIVQYTAFDAGIQTTGTYTPSISDGNIQKTINGGAHTLAPPSVDTTLIIQYTNNDSAGTITTSGFTIVTGDSLTTTSGDDFLAYIAVVNSFSHLNIVALQ